MARSVPAPRVWALRRIWRDPVIVASVLWTVLGTVLFFTAAGDTVTQVRVFWIFQPPLDLILVFCSWRVGRLATGPIRKFWLVVTGAATLFLAGDTLQAVLTVTDPAHRSTTGGAVQTTCLAVGLLSVVVSMLLYPRPAGSGRNGLAYWLDAATVLVAGVVLAWCFVISPAGGRGTDIAGALTAAGVALAAAFAAVRLTLAGNAPVHRLAAAPMISSAIVMSAGAFLAPVGPAGALPAFVYAIRLLPSVLISAGPRIQELLARFDSAPFGSRRHKPYSLLPYGSILITFSLLIFALPGGVNARLWGVVVGLIVITGLVVARQLVAFHDNARLINRLDQTLDELRRHEARLLDQALYDGLTKLANRTHFTEQAAEALTRARWPGEVCLLLIDLDDFKTVNDTRGHATGDALLIHVAERLRAAVRPDDVVARLGGDEFAVLVRGRPAAEVDRTAQRILDNLAQPIRIQQTDLLMRASIGVADGGGRDDVESLLREADIAMYESKARGKGAWTRYSAEMGVRIRRGADLTAQLGEALDAGRFSLEYQPIVRLATGEVTACEALLRWHTAGGRMSMPPAEFIPVAEESGLIVPIGHWVLGEACRQAAEWRRHYPAAATLVVNVNVAGRQLRQPGFAATVAEALRVHRLPAACLSIEVTETAVLADESAIATMHALRELGVGLALDDFGTAASSLGLLLTCPVTTLKLDRSFVEGVITVDRQAAVAMAVSQIADALSLSSVAEGVETPEQAQVLLELGYHHAQGFLFSRPLPPEGLAAILTASPRAGALPNR